MLECRGGPALRRRTWRSVTAGTGAAGPGTSRREAARRVPKA